MPHTKQEAIFLYTPQNIPTQSNRLPSCTHHRTHPYWYPHKASSNVLNTPQNTSILATSYLMKIPHNVPTQSNQLPFSTHHRTHPYWQPATFMHIPHNVPTQSNQQPSCTQQRMYAHKATSYPFCMHDITYLHKAINSLSAHTTEGIYTK